MDSSEIEEFNWNLRHFLDVLGNFERRVNKANPTTIQLLGQTVDKLGNLLENVEEIEDGRNETIVLSIDDSRFDIRRSIFCRMCEVEFGATRNEYILHSADANHNRKLIECMNNSDTNNNAKVESRKSLSIDEAISSNEKVRTEPLHDSSTSNDDQNTSKSDATLERERKLSNSSQHQQNIPNVFEDEIFDFLATRDISNNETGKLNETKVKNGLNNESKRNKEIETGGIPKNTWQSSSNGNSQTAHVGGMRRNSVDTTSKSNHTNSSSTNGITQSGAVFTGVGIKQCVTYQLNNMYDKFPHLSAGKVPDPLIPPQTHKTRQIGAINARNTPAGFDKANRRRDTRSRDRNNLSSSSASKNDNSLVRRGHSSTDLTSASKAIDSTQQKNDYKPTAQPNGGAIPKQLNRSCVQKDSNKSPNSVDGVSDTLIDSDELKIFFSNDLSSLIRLTIAANSRETKIELQQKLIESIENSLKPKFSPAKAYLIGSHAYNIAKGGKATIDFHLDLHNSFYEDKIKSAFIEGMNVTQKLMEKSEEWSEKVEKSEHSRYAILSAEHIACKIRCTFRFGTGVAVKNTEIIKSLFAAQPVAQEVVICIRLALQKGSKGGEWTTHFSGYVVSLLVLFYFQTAGKLPSISNLQMDVKPVKCGENLVHFKNPSTASSVAICEDRVRDLLIGFFGYYSDFDFVGKIISVFEGREIQKDSRFEDSNSLSPSMHRFRHLLDTEPHRWTANHMCVQDCFDHTRNVTHKIEQHHLSSFKNFCAKSLACIQEAGEEVKY